MFLHTTGILSKYLIITAFLIGCATTEISSDYDKTVDFSKYKTFAWLPKTHFPPLDASLQEQAIDQKILIFVNGELISRGISLDIQKPDLLVMYQLNIPYQEKPIDTPSYRNQFNYIVVNEKDFPSSFMISTPSNYRYAKIASKIGTLTLSLIDRQSKQVIWQGWAESSVTEPADIDVLLPNDIIKIFQRFPIKKVLFERD
ncbi:MAG: DUF4136 domain-containing protein [Microscillaceae bacterium]|nr:DUF4136 domain-containing protein [Microscillaceae bacterium]MDW8461134.1 DUF4136 domain-containing protein [Cytophagales bacterium]